MATPPPPTTPPPSLGGYTVESLMQEVAHRAHAQLQLEAQARGLKLSKRDRDTLDVGVRVGAVHMFKVIGEITRDKAKS